MSGSFRSARNPDTSAGAFDSRPKLYGGRPLPNAESERRELAGRFSAAIDATLYWHPTPDKAIVRVRDEPRGAHFEIRSQDVPIEVVRAIEVRPWLLRQFPTEGGQ
jgi:hypothetical protein